MRCLDLGCPPPAAGSRRCHCAACHRDFTCLTAFDRHQTLTGSGCRCLDPAARGLTQRPDGAWRLPGDRPDGIETPTGDSENALAGVSGGAGVGVGSREAQGGSRD